MFILYYTIIYFFVKNFFFECLYFSEYDIRMFLFVFWLRNRPSIKYVRNQGNGEGSSKMFTDAYRGRGVSRFMCTYALTLSLFMFLSYGVLFYLQKFNLTFIQKGCVCQKWLFFSNEINFYCNEISLFYFQLFFRTKVSQNGFNFNQIESQVHSKFQCDTLLWTNHEQRCTKIYLRGCFTSIFTDMFHTIVIAVVAVT